MAITTMKEFSADKKKKAAPTKRKYNSFEHRVLSGLRKHQTDYVFDIEHMNKIKVLLEPTESIWIEKLSGCFFIRLATKKEIERAYFKWCKMNKKKHNVKSLHQYQREEKLLWATEQ